MSLLADRYRLGRVLGSGGMGDVHRAWDTKLGRFVAVKVFRARLDAVSTRRFDGEARTLAALSHPRLVSVFDAGTDGDATFLVLQLVDGRTLHNRIGDGPLSPEEVRTLGAELADALAYVHANDVVHRDVKPSNILLDTDGDAYLADFGLARLTGSTRLTGTGEMMGTAAYLAPEQVRGRDLGPPVDVYALGLVLLECLTGYREYEGSEVEAAVARLHRPPDLPADLPPDLARLLTRMTALTPRRRPTAQQCAQALRAGTDAPTGSRTRKAILATTAAAAVGLIGATWAFTGDHEHPTSDPIPTRSSTAPTPTTSAAQAVTAESEPPVGVPAPENASPDRAIVPTDTGAPPTEDDPGSTRGKDKQNPGQAKKSAEGATKKNGG
ncbi:protein kinase [Umezawaea endophytica]|uniref:non-specific serine/threonine protein kinase n=1 Tax=Umezawaea endophytica TaxID=1654476 RepID=A0A9X2VSE1_9PSEU|nr:serine/threonine-protein kinase [Umezawaea endophytica]MCS7481766.1 protein kinase [Umezawaea endophytica]